MLFFLSFTAKFMRAFGKELPSFIIKSYAIGIARNGTSKGFKYFTPDQFKTPSLAMTISGWLKLTPIEAPLIKLLSTLPASSAASVILIPNLLSATRLTALY
ncbi:hypothetical protein CA265_11905 [Sphingobacteriaceae bacterium GW460-11-11-14-LB5]|nr:hypothetical protein CA265_11905 [Sphingobacteriaceae bacterium GW460-11-11-14-LB5]